MKAGIYIHIPFCIKKCAYCDFLSFSCGKETRELYVKALIREIRAYKNSQDCEVPTIFIGGGTPSVLEKEQLDRILGAVFETFDIIEGAEVTMEMNPGTVGGRDFVLPQKINRVSVGLQSACDVELKKLGRIHTFKDFLLTYDRLRGLGIQNINVDLISAIPGQSVQSWEESLHTVAKLEPEHISAYSLIVEEGTPFYEMELELPTEEDERIIYRRTKEILCAYGYDRYEISNYAKPGFACVHNSSYWKRADYLGLGLGSSSLIRNRRFCNTKNMKHYLEKSGEPDAIREDLELLSQKAQMEEFMFLGLRMTEGVSKGDFYRQFGTGMEDVYGAVLQSMAEKKLLEIAAGQVRLTEKGVDVSNYVMAEFLLD